jgi:hypothetical protein
MLVSKVKLLVSLVATSAVLLGGIAFAGPASAATPLPNQPAVSGNLAKLGPHPTAAVVKPVVLTAQQTLDTNAVFAASDQTTHRFDAASALRAGASATAVADADAAAILADSGWSVAGTVTAKASAAAQLVIAAAAACAGRNGYHGYYVPWGYQFGANSCNTSKIIAAVGLGAAGAGVVTAALVLIGVTVVAAPIAALVTAIIGFGAASLIVCQTFSSNGATWINLLGTPIASCWGQ